MVTDHVAGKFNDGKLHSKAKADEGNAMSAGVADGLDLSLDSAVAETSGHKDAAYVREELVCVFLCHGLGVNPLDVHRCVRVDAPVFERFYNADVGVVKLDIFSYESNGHILGGMAQVFHHLGPV